MADRPWLPTDATSVQTVGWYRIRDAMGVVAQGADVYNGTDVTAWKDRSGLGNDIPRLVKNDPSDAVYDPNGFGSGLGAVTTSGRYYGTGWFGGVSMPVGKLGAMSAINSIPGSGNNSARILSIGVRAGGSQSGDPQDYGQPNAILFYTGSTDGTNLRTNYGSDTSTTIAASTPLIAGTYFRGGSTNNVQGLAVNGTEVGVQSRTYDNKPANLGIGLNGAYKGAYWQGVHAEHVLFVGTLTLADQQFLEGYLAWNNGTQGSLPASHPYKAAAPRVQTGPVTVSRRRQVLVLN